MKKQIICTLLLCLIKISGTFAQVSEGGTPMSNEIVLNASAIPTIPFPEVNKDSLLAEDAFNTEKNKPYRFGFNHYTSVDLKTAAKTISIKNGKLYLLQLHCPSAMSINIAFSRYFIPPGASLFMYNQNKDAIIGAFTWKNVQEDRMLGCDLLPGETICLEYFEPDHADFSGELIIGRVTHGYRSLLPFLLKTFGASGSCNVNVNCPVAFPFADQKRSVACIIENGNESCSGVLVNNTAQDNKLYFLTANHCLGGATSSNWNTSTWVYRFNWEAAACQNPATSPPTNQSISGSYLRAQNGGSDFALMELFGSAPAAYNLYLAGWDRNDIAADSVFCIHHPSGDIKKFSKAANPVTSSTYAGAQCWKIGQWTLAATEPGSSGSPLYNPQKRIIGQLYGGPSSCNASPNNMNDYYGKFSSSWTGGGTNATRLSNWLDPLNSGITFMDGRNANPPSNIFNIALSNINNPLPNLEKCDNTITPSITITNAGGRIIDSVAVSVQLNGNTTTSYFNNLALSSGQTTILTLAPITSLTPQNYTLVITVSSSSGIIDTDNSNNSLTRNFSVIVPQPQAPFFTHAFQNTLTPSGWSIINPDDNGTWSWNTTTGGFGNSSSCAQFNNYSDNTVSAGQTDYLVSPFIDFTSSLSPVMLRFSRAYAPFQNRPDSLLIAWSDNCGETWNTLYRKGRVMLSTNGGSSVNASFVPTPTQWAKDSVNLNTLIGKNNIRLAFISKSGLGNNLYLDDINLSSNASGLQKISSQNRSRIFPNPNNGKCTLRVAEENQAATIRIYDQTGRLLVEKMHAASQQTIDLDLSHLSRGMYMLQLMQDNLQEVHRFIIR
jgi:lysyl endopeptidase